MLDWSDVRRATPLYLYCWVAAPNSTNMAEMLAYAKATSQHPAPIIFAVHRDTTFTLDAGAASIRVISEDFLLANIVDFSDYTTDIRNRVEMNRFRDTN